MQILRARGPRALHLPRYDGRMLPVVLAALDGSDRQTDVLQQAAALAALHNSALHVCRAVTIPIGMPDAVWSMSMGQLDSVLVEEADKALSRLTSEMSGVTKHVRLGQPADVVCELATELSADLVVIGSHGYGAVERLLGTTASKIVHRAPCSVLVIRPKAEAPKAEV